MASITMPPYLTINNVDFTQNSVTKRFAFCMTLKVIHIALNSYEQPRYTLIEIVAILTIEKQLRFTEKLLKAFGESMLKTKQCSKVHFLSVQKMTRYYKSTCSVAVMCKNKLIF